jgi:hypothetical protein
MSNHDIWNWSMEDQPPPDDQPSLVFETVADLRHALAKCALLPEPDRSNCMILLLDTNLDLRSILPKGTMEELTQVLRSSAPREAPAAVNEVKAKPTSPRLSLEDAVKLVRETVGGQGIQSLKRDVMIPLLLAHGATHRIAAQATSKVFQESHIPLGRPRLE